MHPNVAQASEEAWSDVSCHEKLKKTAATKEPFGGDESSKLRPQHVLGLV
jgi:hypothetical protein